MLKNNILLKALLRDLKRLELGLLFIALVVSVTAICSIAIFTDKSDLTLKQQSASFLGANVVVKSAFPINQKWHDQAKLLNLKQTMALNFYSMASSKDKMQLIEVSAVKPNYPLNGLFTLKNRQGQTTKIQAIPKAGEIWVASKLLGLFQEPLGSLISIGDSTFRSSQRLINGPGQSSNWFNLSPRVIMNWQDIAKTNVVKPGSRLSYQWLLSGEDKQLDKLKQSLKLSRQQQWLESGKSIASINAALEKSLNYFRLGGILSLLLGAISIAIASFRYSLTQTKTIALLRCLGATAPFILRFYLSLLLIIGVFACSIGVLLAYLMQPLIEALIGDIFMPATTKILLMPGVLSFCAGLLILLGFSISYIMAFKKVSAHDILTSQTHTFNQPALQSTLIGSLSVAIVCIFYTSSAALTGKVMIAAVVISCIIMATSIGVFKLLRKLRHLLPMTLRLGLNNIARNNLNSSLQILGICLALTTMASLFLLRFGLLNAWQENLPKNAANYFVLNIENNQLNQIKSFFKTNHILSSKIYSTTRGRLTKINNQTINQAIGPRAKNIGALQRELNLSSSKFLPQGNQVIAGKYGISNDNLPWISVEKGVADRVGLKLGDIIEFTIAGSLIEAKITSIRTVNWANFRPNFFFLFEPGVLNKMAATSIASIYLSKSQSDLLTNLVSKLPNITIINIANILLKLQKIIDSVIKSIALISGFCLILGCILVGLSVVNFSQQKLKEIRLLRILGLSQRQVLIHKFSESLLIGLVAGFIAIVIAYSLNSLLAYTVFDVSLTKVLLWLLCLPFISCFLMIGVSFMIYKNIYEK